MQIAIFLYDGMTLLDAIGPYEVLSRLPDAETRFVAVEAGPVEADTKSVDIVARSSIADVPTPEIVLIPGGFSTRRVMTDDRVLDWVRTAHETSLWTTSVCTGALVLGAAGVLGGKRATTHWQALDSLAEFGADPVSERVVTDGKVVTAAGVSAGIDMALTLAAEVAGEDIAKAIQLGIEYDPQPPFDSGSPRTAPGPLVELMRGMLEQGMTEGAT